MPKQRRERRHYTDEDRAAALAALAANGGDLRRTARQIAVPQSTLANWWKRRSDPGCPKVGAQKREELADRFEQVVRDALALVTPDKLASANVQQLLTAAGIAADKMRLLRNQPTQNVAALVLIEQIRDPDDHPHDPADPPAGGLPRQ